MYLCTATRPKTAYSVGKAAREMENPSEENWSSIKRIFRYLRGTDHGIFYKSGNMAFTVYSDADLDDCTKTMRSTTGVISIIVDGPVSWITQLQLSIALSTIEAEFMASSEAAKKVVWLQRLLNDLGSFRSSISEQNILNFAISSCANFIWKKSLKSNISATI